MSYRELGTRAEKLARRLRRKGSEPEQRVGVLIGRGGGGGSCARSLEGRWRILSFDLSVFELFVTLSSGG